MARQSELVKISQIYDHLVFILFKYRIVSTVGCFLRCNVASNRSM